MQKLEKQREKLTAYDKWMGKVETPSGIMYQWQYDKIQRERNFKKLENRQLIDRARLAGYFSIGQRAVFKKIIKKEATK